MMDQDKSPAVEEQGLSGEAQLLQSARNAPSPVANRRAPNPNLSSPILLAIDTCTNRSSVALRDAQVLRAECSWESDRHHTAAVSAQIRRLLDTCDISAAQIGAVAVAIGPGSFTGVRCGLAIAKGMASARNIPVIGVSAFDIVSAAQPNLNLPMLTLVEVGRSRVAAQRYDWQENRLAPAGEWRILSWNDLAAVIDGPIWVCGDLAPGLISLLGPNAIIAEAPLNLRRAGYLAEIGYLRWTNGKVDDTLTLTPIYPPENQPH
ncbi:MAG TPA: tRNA (adenosine(37)-N6)-threonylcarbamoyltransferase complex dimerization subunit type 1 TsaB [Anaerolineae bacterium]|jgi:tRNA threonylcarbamoyladenosine biosynthesis protein TsaB